jgi:hypothetical protein
MGLAIILLPIHKLTMGLILVGAFFIGDSEAQAAVSSTFPLKSQEELGTAGGLASAIRSFVSVLSVAIYSAGLANLRGQTIPPSAIPAAKRAGLPFDSVPALLSGLAGTTALTSRAMPGLIAGINATTAEAHKYANSEIYMTVFLHKFCLRRQWDDLGVVCQ